jgi:hypothetical protein
MAIQKRFNFGRAGTLFNRKTIKRELTKVVFEPTDRQLKAAKNWAEQVRHPNFRKANETAVRGEFIQTVLVTVLGYTPYRAGKRSRLLQRKHSAKAPWIPHSGSFPVAKGPFLRPLN